MASKWDLASPGLRAVMIAAPAAFLGSAAVAVTASDWWVLTAAVALFYASAGTMLWLTVRKLPSIDQ
jgi:hypothetical protein